MRLMIKILKINNSKHRIIINNIKIQKMFKRHYIIQCFKQVIKERNVKYLKKLIIKYIIINIFINKQALF